MERQHIAIHRLYSPAKKERGARNNHAPGRLEPRLRKTANACPYNTKEIAIMLMYKKVACLAAVGALCAAPPLMAKDPNASWSRAIPANEVKYRALGGPQLGTVWGDSTVGPHGSFLR